jgi:hypothetical protein
MRTLQRQVVHDAERICFAGSDRPSEPVRIWRVRLRCKRPSNVPVLTCSLRGTPWSRCAVVYSSTKPRDKENSKSALVDACPPLEPATAGSPSASPAGRHAEDHEDGRTSLTEEVNAASMRRSASYYDGSVKISPSITMRGSQRSPGTCLGSSWAAPGGDR